MRKFILALILSAAAAYGQNPNTAKFPAAVATDQDLLVASNSCKSTLNGAIDNVTLTIVLADASKCNTPTALTIESEVVKICSKSGNTLTACAGGRGFHGTAASHASGNAAYGYIDQDYINQIAAEVKAVQNGLGANFVNMALLNWSTPVFSEIYDYPQMILQQADTHTGSMQSRGPLVLYNPDQTTNNWASLLFASKGTNGNIYGNAGIFAQFGARINGYHATDLVFGTQVVGAGGPLERMRITGDGRVGVNTSDPKDYFDVRGNILVTGGILSNSYHDGSWKATTTGFSAFQQFDRSTGNWYLWTSPSSITADSITSLTTRLFVQPDGKVGINNTSPSTIFHVKGSDSDTRIKVENTGTGDAGVQLYANSSSWFIDNRGLLGGVQNQLSIYGPPSSAEFVTILPGSGDVTFKGKLTAGSLANATELNPADYVYSLVQGGGIATGNLAGAGAKSVSLSSCPKGYSAAMIGNASVRILGGGGADETLTVAGWADNGGGACTIIVTTAVTHPGSWTLTNNGDGLQEALLDAAVQGKAVRMGTGYWGFYRAFATINVPSYVTLRGSGSRVSIIQAQTNNIVILNAPGDNNTFEDFTLTNLGNSQGVSGNVGIQLGTSTHSNGFSHLTRLYFDFLYDHVLSINAAQMLISDCTFWDQTHAAIIFANPYGGGGDAVGGQVINSNFFNYNVPTGTPAEAFILVHSTSSLLVSNNNFIAAKNVNYCVESDQAGSGSGGWMGINGNKCEASALGAYRFSGEWTQLAVVGNMLAPMDPTPNWVGVKLSGTYAAGMYRVVIASNVIQCGGTGTEGVHLEGNYSRVTVASNDISACNFGINANGSPVTTLLSSNNITGSASAAVFTINSNVVIDSSSPFLYGAMIDTVAGIGNAGPGSRVFCSNCNSTCNGTGTGRMCFKEATGTTWTH